MQDSYGVAYVIKKNKSHVNLDGKLITTKSCGVCKIVASVDTCEGKKTKGLFLVEFEDGTIIKAHRSSLAKGEIKNPLTKRTVGVGYIGIGKWKAYNEGRNTSEYVVWAGIIRRCYDEKQQKKQPTYKGCSVVERWHNFQNFCEDIINLPNHGKWKKGRDTPGRNLYQLDKDIKVKGNKVYSKETCIFVHESENSTQSSLTGKTYVGLPPEGVDRDIEEFYNMALFAREHNLNASIISGCIAGKYKQHKGWTFKIKEETP